MHSCGGRKCTFIPIYNIAHIDSDFFVAVVELECFIRPELFVLRYPQHAPTSKAPANIWTGSVFVFIITGILRLRAKIRYSRAHTIRHGHLSDIRRLRRLSLGNIRLHNNKQSRNVGRAKNHARSHMQHRRDETRNEKCILRVHTQPAKNQFESSCGYEGRRTSNIPIRHSYNVTRALHCGHCPKTKISKVEIKSMEREKHTDSPTTYA